MPNGNDTFPMMLTRLASSCRAGDIRSRPSAAKRGRAMRASLERMAPVWPHAYKQVLHWGRSNPQASFPAETPLDSAGAAHDASDVLADAIVEYGLPRHQLETDAVIDHGEAAAGELG